MKKSIWVVTSSRADYGLMKPLYTRLRNDHSIELNIIVTGSHLSDQFGMTYREIVDDGFRVIEKVPVLLDSDSSTGVCKGMGLTLISFADIFSRNHPDGIIVMGDRYEIFSAVAAAFVHRIPVIHFSGGEITVGALDDVFRHSITKMSSLHFTATKEYRERVIQLGEQPEHVHDVGELGLDKIHELEFYTKEILENELNLKFKKRNVLITIHPETIEDSDVSIQLNSLFSVLEGREDTLAIFTKSNADYGGRIINTRIDDYVRRSAGSAVSFKSLGRLRYLSLMRLCDAVVGNSSSGIVEAPSFKVGTINIGSRQLGRVHAESIIDCEYTQESIGEAFKMLFSDEFQKGLTTVNNPYEKDGGIEITTKLIKDYINSTIEFKKVFFDLPHMLSENK